MEVNIPVPWIRHGIWYCLFVVKRNPALANSDSEENPSDSTTQFEDFFYRNITVDIC